MYLTVLHILCSFLVSEEAGLSMLQFVSPNIEPYNPCAIPSNGLRVTPGWVGVHKKCHVHEAPVLVSIF